MPELVKEPEVLALWHEGHGMGTIALKLSITTAQVRMVLMKHGLKRTREESLEIRARNKLHYNGGPRHRAKKEIY